MPLSFFFPRRLGKVEASKFYLSPFQWNAFIFSLVILMNSYQKGCSLLKKNQSLKVQMEYMMQ